MVDVRHRLREMYMEGDAPTVERHPRHRDVGRYRRQSLSARSSSDRRPPCARCLPAATRHPRRANPRIRNSSGADQRRRRASQAARGRARGRPERKGRHPAEPAGSNRASFRNFSTNSSATRTRSKPKFAPRSAASGRPRSGTDPVPGSAQPPGRGSDHEWLRDALPPNSARDCACTPESISARRAAPPIHAAAAGVVINARVYGRLRERRDHRPRRRHCNRIWPLLPAAGVGRSTVAKGDHIADVGSTGLATGPHLHFEVHVHGKAVDPRGWL